MDLVDDEAFMHEMIRESTQPTVAPLENLEEDPNQYLNDLADEEQGADIVQANEEQGANEEAEEPPVV